MSPDTAPRTRLTVVIALTIALVTVAAVAVPLYIIRPFVPQDPRALAVALEVRSLAPWVTLFCAVVLIYLTASAWRRSRWPARSAFIVITALTCVIVVLARINIFERMFHPNPSPSFVSAAQATVDPGDMLLAVDLGGFARAYPIRYLGYHHIINDTVDNQPLAITYCTLCHTGLVWSRVLDGRTLYFHLAGINNGNALLRDVQTSSIWQQSTGECIFGHYRGRRLTLVSSSELSFALWRSENPSGDVLRPDPTTVAEYDPKDWEQHIVRTHVVVDVSSSGIDPHEIVFAVSTSNTNRAYPVRKLLAAGLIQDKLLSHLAANPSASNILLVVGPDNASIRAFAPGDLNFVRAPTPTDSAFMTDIETGSSWNFQGCAVSGKLAGRCLHPLDGHKSFWFDWLHHHPDTSVYRG